MVSFIVLTISASYRICIVIVGSASFIGIESVTNINITEILRVLSGY